MAQESELKQAPWVLLTPPRTGDRHRAWWDEGRLVGWPGPSPLQPPAGHRERRWLGCGGEMEEGRAKGPAGGVASQDSGLGSETRRPCPLHGSLHVVDT